MLFRSELLCAVIKQLLVHLHVKLQSIVNEAMDGPVQRESERKRDRKREQEREIEREGKDGDHRESVCTEVVV